MRRIALALFLAAGCTTHGSNAFSDGTDAEPVLVTKCTGVSPDTFSLDGVILEGKRLRASVSYGGGCNDHVFAACWDGAVVESVAEVVILHQGFDDMCDAFVTRDVVVDLSMLPFTTIQSVQPTETLAIQVTGT